MSVASVTVVYNGEHVIPRHLDAILAQSHRVDELIVVNNASTDRTSSLLARLYPEVTVLNLPTNEGVGGGYVAGLQYAIARGHDWVWQFDQDSIPANDALAYLLDGLERHGATNDGVAIIAPKCMNLATGREYPGLRWQNRWKTVDFDDPIGVEFVDAVISSGSLLRCKAIERVGLPRADYFIDYIDMEYCLRLRRAGYKIAVIRRSILEHAVGAPRVLNIAGYKQQWADHVPWREYYKTRNEIFTVWHFQPELAAKYSALQRLTRHALGILLFGREKIACLRMMWLGVRDGLAGRLGIRSFEVSASAGDANA